MYHAKHKANKVAFYEPSLGQKAKQAFTIESDLHRALSQKEFRVFFQPQMDAENQNVVGVEALIRWFTPDGKMVPSRMSLFLLRNKRG